MMLLGSGVDAVSFASPDALCDPAGDTMVICSVSEKLCEENPPAELHEKVTEAVVIGLPPVLHNVPPCPNNVSDASAHELNAVDIPASWFPLTNALQPTPEPLKLFSET
jgi:hypothetical protein